MARCKSWVGSFVNLILARVRVHGLDGGLADWGLVRVVVTEKEKGGCEA